MRTAIAIILLSLKGFCSYGQPGDRKDALIADLEIYACSLRTLHTDAFHSIGCAEFDSIANTVITASNELSNEEILVEFLKLNARVNDEHTIVQPAYKWRFPIRLAKFEEGMFIVAADEENVPFLMSKILAVNGHSFEIVEARFKPLIKQDNPGFVDLKLEQYMATPELLIGLDLADTITAFEFTLLSPDGDTAVIPINPIPIRDHRIMYRAQAFRELLAYKDSMNYWYSYIDEGKSLYFQYRRCREDPRMRFAEFNKTLIRSIRANEPEKLILDLRRNGGGDSSILRPFLRKIRRSKLNGTGRFYVLIGKRTFSSAVMNAVTLKKRTNAIFIGETTGGNVNSFGEVRSFELPNTGATVTYSTKYWENWQGRSGGLQPDLVVEERAVDLIRSTDRPLRKAIEQ